MKFHASFIVLLSLANFAVAADNSKAKWSVDDVVLQESATAFVFSPDGNWAVWVKTVMNKEKGERSSNLMRSDLTEHLDIELTRSEENCHSPSWSPDGKLIAFLSARPAPKSADERSPARRLRAEEKDEAKSQLWLMSPFGGEAWRLTDFKRGVTHFGWADSNAIVFGAQEEETLFEQKTKEDKDTTTVVEDEKHEPPARLFRVEVKGKKITRLTTNNDQIDYLAVSPDGKWAVARHNRSLSYTFDSKIKPVVFLHDLSKGTRESIFTDKKFNMSSVKWALDSKGFYAINEFNNHPQFSSPAIAHLHWFDLATSAAKQIDLDWDNGLAVQDANDNVPGIAVTEDGFIALLANGARHKIARYTRDGDKWKRGESAGGHAANIFGMAVAADGKSLVYAYTTASKPVEWHHAALDGTQIGKPEQIAILNEDLKEKPIAKSEVIRWKGAHDEEVEGILYYPHEYEKGKKYPLVVMIHGGPMGADFDSWDDSWAYAANLFAQRGAIVFKPNYHGSSNYGLKWLESIAGGKYYDLEVPDIEKGVDHLIEKGLVDKDKLGLLGWSNGSILTIELTVRTTRYKVASAGAGDVDWISDWGNCEFGESFDRFYLGKGPFEDPQLYIKKSPFYRLDKVRTPTLIFFGSEDRTVATQQGWMHYRALQQLGKTDVRFVLFPGEKHSPKKYVHQKRKLQEELDWFDKHLFKTAKVENEAVKDDSPLARALKLQGAKKDKGTFGLLVKDQLIPETVEHSGMQLGRFEITRAQYQSFDVKYQFAKGTENYPATGISFESAKRYCEWLSKLTGDTYRLPTEEEGDELYTAGDGENTLDHWAGYKVNPDDAKRLREKIQALGRDSLLKEVGQFKPTGDEGVFDLGGNVAEWVTTEDGKGKLMGGSADQPADAKSTLNKAAEEYRGFRVRLAANRR